MDNKLQDGKFVIGKNGLPLTVLNADEIYQQVVIRLTVRRNLFYYNKDFGSLLYTLKSTDNNLQEKATKFALQALRECSNVELTLVEVSKDGFYVHWKQNGDMKKTLILFDINTGEMNK